MNTRIRQTLASLLAATAMTFGAPLLTSAQEAPAHPRAERRGVRMEPMQQQLQLDAAQIERVREIMRGARAERRSTRARRSRDALRPLRPNTVSICFIAYGNKNETGLA